MVGHSPIFHITQWIGSVFIVRECISLTCVPRNPDSQGIGESGFTLKQWSGSFINFVRAMHSWLWWRVAARVRMWDGVWWQGWSRGTQSWERTSEKKTICSLCQILKGARILLAASSGNTHTHAVVTHTQAIVKIYTHHSKLCSCNLKLHWGYGLSDNTRPNLLHLPLVLDPLTSGPGVLLQHSIWQTTEQ